MILAFNKDVFGLPIAMSESQIGLSRIMNLNNRLVSKYVRTGNRNKRLGLKFIECENIKSKKYTCYAVYDCSMGAETLINLCNSMTEVSFFLECSLSTVKQLVKNNRESRKGYKVEKIILEE